MSVALSRLNHPDENPFEQLTRIGLALLCGPPPAGREQPVRHIGILFPSEDGATTRVRLIHLAWHCLLKEDSPEMAAYSWLELPLPEELSPMIVQLCRLLIRKYAKGKDPLAYALRYDGGRFDPGTGCFLSESGHGLTCATFVLAVFKSHGVDLLRTDQWRERDEDKKWQQWILDELGDARYATPEHIRAVEREIKLGCARFRPQEVAAAKAPLSARVEKRGPWITTTVPPSCTVAPVLRMPSRAIARMPA